MALFPCRPAFRGRHFLVAGDSRLTFTEHDEAVRVFAAFLGTQGVRWGDRVAIVATNSPEWVVAFWAVIVLGAVVVPLNPWWTDEVMAFAVDHCGARVVVCDEVRLAGFEQRAVLGAPVIGLPAVIGDALVEAGDAPSPGAAQPQLPEQQEDDVAAIFYTSGTTGRPKGATITHRQILANLQNLGLRAALDARLRGDGRQRDEVQPSNLLAVPLFHVTGCLSTMVVNYIAGGKVVLLPQGRFDPEAALAAIERERVTTIGGVPTVLVRMLDSPTFASYDLSSVRRISFGGGPAPPALVDRLRGAFPQAGRAVGQGYGLTETASMVTVNIGSDYVAKPDSVGPAVPTIELNIRGESGEPLPPGDVGEVWVRGPTVMAQGYWRDPKATAEAVIGGWFRTRDVGYLDDEGFLFLVDRAADVIVRSGENIYTIEIESALAAHPAIADVAVVGVPHRELGEAILAVVQLRERAKVDDPELRAFCRERLMSVCVPDAFAISHKPLPRNDSGKVDKRALRERAADRAPGVAPRSNVW
jgi:long-chain acyl-CoA synthetase